MLVLQHIMELFRVPDMHIGSRWIRKGALRRIAACWQAILQLPRTMRGTNIWSL